MYIVAHKSAEGVQTKSSMCQWYICYSGMHLPLIDILQLSLEHKIQCCRQL